MNTRTRTTLSVALLLTMMIPLTSATEASTPAATSGLTRSVEAKATLYSTPHVDLLELRLPPSAIFGTTTVYAETQKQIDMVESAIDRFARAGLELPPVTIHMHTSRAHCSIYPKYIRNGYYIQIDGEHVIHSCDNEWTLLHELGHVWDSVTLDDTTRQQILDLQGLESWRHETWNQAGAEHLASIVAWALEGTHPNRIGNYTLAELADVYFAATGTQPPRLAGSET
ncbi:MAG: hypothetical protein U9N84_03565 [Actinomycetota bacterium]|nr:hypothetical protein [Actinomycetota bacterium]